MTREFLNSLSTSGEKENVKDFLKYSQFDIETFLKRAKKRKTKVVHKSIPKKIQEESVTINRKNDISKIESSTRFPHFQPNKNLNKRRKHFKTSTVSLKKISTKTDSHNFKGSLAFSEVSPLDNGLAVETEDFKRELTEDDGVQVPPPSLAEVPQNPSPKHVFLSGIKETQDKMNQDPVIGQFRRVTPINGTFVPVSNWRNSFQPYLITTTRPETSTTKSYEFASQNSFVSINLGPKEINKEVYPFAEGVAINSNPDLPVTKDVIEDTVEAVSIKDDSTDLLKLSAHNSEDKPQKLPPKIPEYLSSIYHLATPPPFQHHKKKHQFNHASPHNIPLNPTQQVFPQFPTSTFPPFHEDLAPEDQERKVKVLDNDNIENYIPMSLFKNNRPVEVSTLPPFFSRPTPFPNLPHLFPGPHPTTVRPVPLVTQTTPYPLFHHSTTPLPLPHHTTPAGFQVSTPRPSILHPNSFHLNNRAPAPHPLSPSIHKVTPLPIFYNSVTPTSHPRPEPTYRYSTLAPSSSLPSLIPSFFSPASTGHHFPPPSSQANSSSDPLLDSAFAPSTRDETIILGDEFKPKRSSIADVLKSFKQRTYESLQSPRNKDFQSFSYQKYTTPAQNVNILSQHSTTTTVRPPALFLSPTPKLTNPFELVSVENSQTQSLWRDSDIVLSFKSEPEAPLPPEESNININNPPQYSQEKLYSSAISAPIRFQQVTSISIFNLDNNLIFIILGQ